MDSSEKHLKKDAAAADVATASPMTSTPENELPPNLPQAYQQVLAEKKELFERLLRKQAELENLRKRQEREKEDFLQLVNADLIRALLPTLDSLERALRVRNDDVPQDFYQGLELIHRDLLDVLGRAGMSVVSTKGEKFNPHVHQAIETVESDRHRDQEIVEELQKGYLLRHRLLRPAIVKVAVGKEDAASQDPDARTSKE